MSGKLRALTATLLLCAVAIAVGLAAAPQLHDRLHQSGANHVCAATLLSSGSVELTPGAPLMTERPDTPSVQALPGPSLRRVGALLGIALLEHAPPVSR